MRASSASRCRWPASLLLAARANLLAAVLALATLVVYLVVYTPMKRRTPLSTLVGAVPGALPRAHRLDRVARQRRRSAALTLFAIVFLWQIPHFMAIAWMYRDDYRKAGFPMLPVIEPNGRRAGRQAVLFAAMLVPVSLVAERVGRVVYGDPCARPGSVRPRSTVCDGAQRRLGTRAVLRLDHLSAAHLDRDDSREALSSSFKSQSQLSGSTFS